MNLKEANKVVAVLQASWPNHPWHENADQVYHMGLDDLEYDAVMAVLPAIIKSATFAPVPAEIRKFVIGDPYSELPTGEAAWENVMYQVKRNGMWHREFVSFESPLTERTVHAIGWEAICLCDFDDLNTLRAQFLRMHNGYRDTAVAAIRRGVHPDIAVLPDGPRNVRIVAGADLLPDVVTPG